MESQREIETGDVDDRAGEPEQATDGPAVSAHSTSKDRVVFTESENTDGWIATDLAVEASRYR